ncbi:MAG: hypothetical protein R8J94_07930 [Acidimicrobiia bacterium]|nr:hypothetical protein [Acidimicrobiia bacterium]
MRTLQSVPDLEPSMEITPLAPPPVPVEAVEAAEPVAPPVPEFSLVEAPPVPVEPNEPEFAPNPEPAMFETQPTAVDAAPVDVPAPVEITMAEDKPDELVFVLDGPLESDVPAPTLAPPPVPDELETSAVESDPGWVSHHNAVPASDPEPQMLAEMPLLEPELETLDVEASVETAMETSFLEQDVDAPEVEPAFEPPQWGEVVEQPDEPEPIAMDVAVDEDTPAPPELHYGADEELPIPDFTGVWADSEEPTVWDNDPSIDAMVPGPVEDVRSGNGISVGRNELDSLRPAEEAVAAKPEQNLGRKLQLVGVVLFGLIALAVMFLDDPAVVDELRELYDGFFG